jgi:hypothetical protein
VGPHRPGIKINPPPEPAQPSAVRVFQVAFMAFPQLLMFDIRECRLLAREGS